MGCSVQSVVDLPPLLPVLFQFKNSTHPVNSLILSDHIMVDRLPYSALVTTSISRLSTFFPVVNPKLERTHFLYVLESLSETGNSLKMKILCDYPLPTLYFEDIQHVTLNPCLDFIQPNGEHHRSQMDCRFSHNRTTLPYV